MRWKQHGAVTGSGKDRFTPRLGPLFCPCSSSRLSEVHHVHARLNQSATRPWITSIGIDLCNRPTWIRIEPSIYRCNMSQSVARFIIIFTQFGVSSADPLMIENKDCRSRRERSNCCKLQLSKFDSDSHS